MVLKPFKNIFSKIPALLNHLAFWKKTPQTQVKQIHSKRQKALNAEKQDKLENLCNELFKRKELITSGKLQLIGLAKIKQRMGKKWDGLSKIVYDTTEDVMNKHMDKGDIFVRYKDDTYIIIFAHAAPEESRLKSALIAEEIRRRLFELDEDELKDLEIRQAVSEIRTDMLMNAEFPEGMFGMMNDEFDDWEDDFGDETEQQEQKEAPPEIKSVDVGTDQHKKGKSPLPKSSEAPVNLDCAYMPLWDTQRGALTTYLCMARSFDTKTNLLDDHKELYKGKDPDEKMSMDKAMLKIVTAELASMEKDGRKFFIVCPVQHETVFRYESYEEYKELLSKIPLAQRAFLMLLVMNMEDGVAPKKAYWFAKPLRAFCPYVFAEVPLRRDLNFRYLAESGVNVAGVRLDKNLPEQEVITVLNGFGSKAKSHKLPKTFILGVNSLSITTSAVCAGFSFLGGSAIHDAVEKPDTVHRYQYEDLISELNK